MSNSAISAIAWLALAVHLVIGLLVWRGRPALLLLNGLNLVTALCVLGYWGVRWWGYLFRGITWYASDQLVPLYALTVAVLAVMTLLGRLSFPIPLWLIFGVDTLVLLGAALFLTFFRMTRLI